MTRSILCDESDAYIVVEGKITISNTGTAAASSSKGSKLIHKNYAPFTDCISEKHNKEIEHAKEFL